jgi:hypothetical protein
MYNSVSWLLTKLPTELLLRIVLTYLVINLRILLHKLAS